MAWSLRSVKVQLVGRVFQQPTPKRMAEALFFGAFHRGLLWMGQDRCLPLTGMLSVARCLR